MTADPSYMSHVIARTLASSHCGYRVYLAIVEMEPLGPLAVRFRRSTRTWQIIASVSCVVAVVIAILFASMCYSKSSCKNYKSCEQQKRSPLDSRCPGKPPLFALPKPLPSRIDEALDKIDKHLLSIAAKAQNKSAISINIFYRDAVVWKGHYGSKTYKGSVPPDDNTKYRIGSVTKIFAVLLLFKLREDGLISSLDDPLSKYASEFSIKNPFTNAQITLRQIAGQMSGLPREAPCVYSCSGTNSTEQLKILKRRNLVVKPWTQPSYSNLGYALLGRLLTENLLNITFEAWVEEEVLKPLGMANTGFKITDKVLKNIAFPYYPNGTLFPFMTLGWADPAGGMYSTVQDLMKLNAMLTNPSHGPKILKQNTIRELLLPEFITRDGLWLWGSPFEMRFVRGFVARQKGGNIDSYNAGFSVIPELQVAMNIFVNNIYVLPKQGTTCFDVADFVHDVFLQALNETLFEMRKDAKFPIDSKPFLGTYQVTQILALTQRQLNFTAVIEQDGEKLLVIPKANPRGGFALTYIGKPLLFQGEAFSGLGGSCVSSHLGLFGMVKFDPPDAQGFSPGFSAACWKVFAKRITGSSTYESRDHSIVEPRLDDGPSFFSLV